MKDENFLERALGSRGRSGGQWDIWQAVFSPVDADGYPKPIWDKSTGRINPETAAYWKEHYDLRALLERDWAEIGSLLEGKLHIYVGDMDNFHLNNAVELLEEFLESTADPCYGGTVEYGMGRGHCWFGEREEPSSSIHVTAVRRAAVRYLESAPAGADTRSWRY